MKALLIRTGPSFELPELYGLLLLHSSSAIVAVGTILKHYGMDVDYWHIPIKFGIPTTQNEYDERLKKFRKLVKYSDYDFIGFSCISGDEYIHILEFAKICKEEKPDTITVMGGYHATIVSQEIMNDTTYIDIIVRGDFEPICEKFIIAFKNHNLLKDVPNVIFRRNGKIIETQRLLIKYDINSLPKYDFSLIGEYLSSLCSLSIEGSRGCKFKCEYCTESAVRGGHFWSVKKPDRLIDEIKNYSSFIEKHVGYKRFFFVDPLFGIDRKWLNDFCKKLIGSNLDVTWGCETRLDRLSNDEMKLMRNAGCTFIFHGFESGSPKMLKLMGKTNNPEKYLRDAIETVKMAKENDICLFGSYMLGYPGETMDTLQETKNLIEKQIEVGRDYFYPSLLFFIPYPGTHTHLELNEFYKKFGTKVLVDDIWKYSKTCLQNPVIQPSKELDASCLLKFRDELRRWVKNKNYNVKMASSFGAPTNIDYKADLIELGNPCCLPPLNSLKV